MQMKPDFSNPFKALFLLWAAACIVILPVMSFNAGITEDELQHMEHGNTILAWYEGKDSTASVSPFVKLNAEQLSKARASNLQVLEKGLLFDSVAIWKADPAVEGVGSKTAINIYGGLFDSFSALVYQKITHHFWGEFESKHVISALFGALLLIFIGLICFRITGNWQTAFLGLVIATFAPRLIGNSLSNPKDIPQATMFAFSLLQMVSFLKELPTIRIKRLILLGLSFSLAMAIRSGAVLLIFYFVPFASLYVVVLLALGDLSLNRAGKILFAVGIVSILGYLGCSLFWPWAFTNPVLNPLRSLVVFRNFSSFDCYEIFEGHWLHQNELPWYFVPKWLYITLPVTAVFGFLLFFIMLPRFLQKGGLNLLIYCLLLFSVAFPILSIIIGKSNIYNSCRHVLFIIPSVIVIAALGWAELFKRIKNMPQRRMVYGVFIILIAEPACFIFNNNPVQAMYFSPLIGGQKGAFKNYEMDYWGYSVRPAINWIAEHDTLHLPGKKARVRMYYGEQMKLTYYVDTTRLQTDSSKRLAYALCPENSTDWDYEITMVAEAKNNQELLLHWPPQNTVYQVETRGVPLCAVVKNFRIQPAPANNNSEATVTFGQPVDSSNYCLGVGIGYYQKANYNQAVIFFKKSVGYNPQNKLAINDLVASYNQLKMFDEAILEAKKGLALDSKFDLLKNNLAESLKAKSTFVPNEAYYHNLSYNYYVQQNYLKTIEAARNALKFNPNSSIAWNNICSAYNQLKEYQKALDACDRGLKIDAQNAMLKNNRAEAARMAGQR